MEGEEARGRKASTIREQRAFIGVKTQEGLLLVKTDRKQYFPLGFTFS